MTAADRRGFLRRLVAPGRATPAPAATDGPKRITVAPHCLVPQRVECRLCAEACDAGALRYTPAPGGAGRLRVDTERCTGCGDCLAPCPVGALALTVPNATPDERP